MQARSCGNSLLRCPPVKRAREFVGRNETTVELELDRATRGRIGRWLTLPLLLLTAAIAGCPVFQLPYPCGELPVRGNEAGDETRSISFDGLERSYLVHPPAGWDGTTPLPVVLGFHGGAGRAETFRTASGLNAVADRNDFLVVYPNGTGPNVVCAGQEIPIQTWNAGGCCGFAMENGIDDVGFIRALLDDLPQHYAVDLRRVYATGISNGAMMSYRLAVELADRITAIAPVAGAMMIEGEPSRPVPVIHFHGLMDENAPYFGGVGANADINPIEHNSVPDTIAFWVNVNHDSPEPVVELIADAVIETYEPPEGVDGASVVLYRLPGGGHNWPGGTDVTQGLDTGPLIESVDASEIIWQFFSDFALPSG